MSDTIDRQAAIDELIAMREHIESRMSVIGCTAYEMAIEALRQPEIIRCKDCKNQEKFFQKDGRRKDGGYYIYGCYLAEGYSHVCLDDDYCSRADRKV